MHDEMPDSASMLSEKLDRNGKRWINLQAYAGWTSRMPEQSDSESYRLVWMHLHSYLIPVAKTEVCWKWLKKQNFFGGWMLGGAEFHDGFVGEYPWATTVNLYEDSYLSRGGFGKKGPPFETYPASNLLYVSHEEDAYQEGSINLMVPARKFFADTALKWNGASGYALPNGELCLVDPSLTEPGPMALLIESDFLRGFLANNKLAIFWTVVGEKLRIHKPGPRFVYSRAHILTEKGLRSSKPIITDE